MPNGVSCAYFAARNHIYGKNEGNMFKEGIAGIQTVRSVDAVTSSATMANHVSAPVKGFFSKAAGFLKKLVYPLIIASGIYNTAKSDDKVKTGVSQAAGIGTMFAFEEITERALKGIKKKLMSNPKVSGNKWARAAWYVAQGAAFVAASLGGYTIGSAGGEAIVDKHRSKKSAKNSDGDTLDIKEGLPNDPSLNPDNVESAIFDDIKL